MIARVVPDIPSFSVDDGFRYRIPSDAEIDVGAIVRVPLGGRKVRGFVVGIETGDAEGLKSIRARSGEISVFDDRLLQSLRWVSQHYVAPLASILKRAAPPNVPRLLKRPPARPATPTSSESRGAALGDEIARGRTRNAYLQSAEASDIADLIWPTLSGGSSVLVVAPTEIETEALAGQLTERFGDLVMSVTPSTSDRDVTTAWSRAASNGGYAIVGTPRVAFWPVARLAAVVVVGEARRAMKDRQTPTVHAREVLRARSVVERFAVVLTGLVPSTEAIAAGTEVFPAVAGRPWSLVELVDRSVDPPGSGLIADRTKTAISAAVNRGESVFVFTHRRGYAAAFRCARCRELRVCTICGARAGTDAECRRCGSELGRCESCGADRFEPLGAGVDRVLEMVGRFADRAKVGLAGEGKQVTVGSVRDIPSVGHCVLAVVIDADGMVLGTDYRAGEEALRSLARVAALVGSGRGRRTIVQTSNPDHPVLSALRRAEPLPFIRSELDSRAELGFPPVGDLIVVECRSGPSDADERLRDRLPDATVLGPAAIEGGQRWLLQAADLDRSRSDLRKLIGEWRDSGATIRVDVDPIDL